MKNFLEVVLYLLKDVIVVYDDVGNIIYSSKPIDLSQLIQSADDHLEYYDPKTDMWYQKLEQILSKEEIEKKNSSLYLSKFGDKFKLVIYKFKHSSFDIDKLTKLPLRSSFERSMNSFMSANKKMVFIIIDIDNFKGVNDNYGHQFGDEVLKTVADTIKKSFRSSDLVSRFGGDEFVVACFETSIDNIKLSIDNLFLRVKSLVFDTKGLQCEIPYCPTISMGIAEFYEDFEQTFKKADDALYYSKESGKNCYTVYEEKFKNSAVKKIYIK